MFVVDIAFYGLDGSCCEGNVPFSLFSLVFLIGSALPDGQGYTSKGAH